MTDFRSDHGGDGAQKWRRWDARWQGVSRAENGAATNAADYRNPRFCGSRHRRPQVSAAKEVTDAPPPAPADRPAARRWAVCGGRTVGFPGVGPPVWAILATTAAVVGAGWPVFLSIPVR
jgi:hypothetical protein